MSLAFMREGLNGSQAMIINDLLLGKGIDPKNILVLRHRTWESQLNQVVPWLAAGRHLRHTITVTRCPAPPAAELQAGCLTYRSSW
jgi:hypothetical protein